MISSLIVSLASSLVASGTPFPCSVVVPALVLLNCAIVLSRSNNNCSTCCTRSSNFLFSARNCTTIALVDSTSPPLPATAAAAYAAALVSSSSSSSSNVASIPPYTLHLLLHFFPLRLVVPNKASSASFCSLEVCGVGVGSSLKSLDDLRVNTLPWLTNSSIKASDTVVLNSN